MKRIFLSLLLFIFVGGCATHVKYKENLHSWLWKTEKELVAVWGTPDGMYEQDGSKFLIYNNIGNMYIPNAHTQGQGLTGSFVTRYCTTKFEIEDDLVIFYDYKGNGCVSR